MNEPDYIDMRGAKYETHLKWLKDPRFVKELEGDNIESDVIQEELSTLKHLENPLTQREKIVKFLKSNPVQIILCIFVLLDASIVVSQILLDINSVKERLHIKDQEFLKLWTFLQDELGETMPQIRKHHSRPHREVLGHDLDINIARSPSTIALPKQTFTQPSTTQTSHQQVTRRSLIHASHASHDDQNTGISKEKGSEFLRKTNNLVRDFSMNDLNLVSKKKNLDVRESFLQLHRVPTKSTPFVTSIDSTNPSVDIHRRKTTVSHLITSARLQNEINKIKITATFNNFGETFESASFISKSNITPSELFSNFVTLSSPESYLPSRVLHYDKLEDIKIVREMNDKQDGEENGKIRKIKKRRDSRRNMRTGNNHSELQLMPSGHRKSSRSLRRRDDLTGNISKDKDTDGFKKAAHILHRISIAILAFLVFEDLVRLVALGKSIYNHKIEILDTVLICASFAVGVFYLGGVTGDDGQQAVVALFVLLVWRVARAVDGIIMTVKQRQEFRIRLQRRVRRKAEKLLEAAESEKNNEIQYLEALQELCLKAGIKQEDIMSICNLKGQKRLSWMLHALSTVARLSVGMSIFPSFGLYRHVSDWCLNLSPSKKYNRMVQQPKNRLPSPQNPPQSFDPRRISSCSTQETSRLYLGLPQKYYTNQELSSYGRRLSDVLTTVSDSSDYRESMSESKINQQGLVNKLQMMNLKAAYDNNISSVESFKQVSLSTGLNCHENKKSKKSNGSRKMSSNVNESINSGTQSHRKKSFKLKQFLKGQLRDNWKSKPKKEMFYLESTENSVNQLKDNQKSKI